MTGACEQVLHFALESAPRPPDLRSLGASRLSDRERVSVLLQASSVLSHLQLAGWRLDDGWQSAWVDSGGLLRGVAAAPGRTHRLPQGILSDLSTRLFRARERVAGRGPARRIMRSLLDRWQQSLTPVAADHAVKQVLDEADFLWRPEFARARGALAAEHVRDGERRLWVAGPSWFRNRLLARAASLDALEEQLASVDLLTLWRELEERSDPRRLSAKGRHRAAVNAWEIEPPEKPEERRRYAADLHALGRFEEAHDALSGLRSKKAAILRLRCLASLGRLAAARRRIKALGERNLLPDEILTVARVAVRVLGNSGDFDGARAWVDRALERTTGTSTASPSCVAGHLEARILAAVASRDRGAPEEMAVWLESSRRALDDPAVAWRWHRAAGWDAMAKGDGAGVVRHLSAALAAQRRELLPFEAANLWNELAIGRAMTGDLAGAERAFLHAARLHGDAQGPRRTTLTFFNLAEIRLRRGRLRGVLEILERSTAENREAGNARGSVHDVALRARYDLVRGRPAAAWDRLRAAIDDFSGRGVDWYDGELRALAARALGWLGEPELAREQAMLTTPEGLAQLEPEERPPLWAHAGDRERALKEIGENEPGDGDGDGAAVAAIAGPGSPVAALWRPLLNGEEPRSSAWAGLDEIEDYRAARFVFDSETLSPGFAPPHRVRRAMAVFRDLGAVSFAERLEREDSGPWRALETFLAVENVDAGSLTTLLAGAGFPDARLSWAGDGGESGSLVILDGAGGSASHIVEADGGGFVVEAPNCDARLRALVRIAVDRLAEHTQRDLSSNLPSSTARGGMIGESKIFLQAMSRASRLAPSEVPVLVTGETGTGKELMARYIHARSRRPEGPFLPLNCAAVSRELLMSDLFGHVRGAFTSADRDRAGVFEAARGGTVFLDEIGDLPLEAQGFLLRVLQEGEVRRIGESLPRKVDVRVVAATHRDLVSMVSDGGFREDLFFRLKVASLELPPLRERGDDILLLARSLVSRACPGEEAALSAAARERLLRHRWPGNVRELGNVLSVAVALAGAGRLEAEHLELPEAASSREEASGLGYHELVLNYRVRLVTEALEASGGNRAEAARRLGLTRQALSYLVKKLGIQA